MKGHPMGFVLTAIAEKVRCALPERIDREGIPQRTFAVFLFY
jgi:hypothetical protein